MRILTVRHRDRELDHIMDDLMASPIVEGAFITKRDDQVLVELELTPKEEQP